MRSIGTYIARDGEPRYGRARRPGATRNKDLRGDPYRSGRGLVKSYVCTRARARGVTGCDCNTIAPAAAVNLENQRAY